MYATIGIKIVKAIQPLNSVIDALLSKIERINAVTYSPASIRTHMIARTRLVFFMTRVYHIFYRF